MTIIMDDLFFTDKNKRNDNNKNPAKRVSRDQFIDDSDYISDFTDNSFTGNTVIPDSHKFNVNIPDDEYHVPSSQDIYSQNSKDRIPQGKPVSQGYPNQQLNRTPQGKPKAYSNNYDVSSLNSDLGETHSSRSRSIQSKMNTDSQQTGPIPTVQKRPNYFVNESSGKKKKKKKKKGSLGKRIAAAILALFFIFCISLFAYGYSLLGKINYDTATLKENEYISESELATDSKVKNILFIGSDYRTGEVTGMRSDTMMLFSIDTSRKKLKLASFLRDSYVYIPSLKKNRKLNAACNGGAQLVIDTIEYNFKVKIDNYILVDFEAFTKLIDLMGGLTVEDVTASEAKYLRDTVKITYAKEGTNHFSGAAALWYCRIRYLDDDFHRTERQRKVISAIINQATHTSPATLMKIMQEVLPMISTDIDRNELLSLGLNGILKYMRYDTVQHQIPAENTWSNLRVYGEGLVLKMNIDQNAELLKQFLYSDESKDE